MVKKKILGQFTKNKMNFLPKKLSSSSQKYGFGIRDPKKPIPDPGVKKEPDPGSGSATLVSSEYLMIWKCMMVGSTPEL